MSSDIAETAVAEPNSTLTGARRGAQPEEHTPRRGAGRRVGEWALFSPLERLRAGGARRVAVRDVWRALWVSRLVVWVAGAGTVATLGFGPLRHAFDPPGSTSGFGRLGDVLAAPAARWDAAWYLTIAHYGYRPDLGAFTAPRTVFFPLYPLGLRSISDLGVPPVLAGVLLSLFALALGLYGLHRLSALEAARLRLAGGGEVARLAVLSCALAPMAFFFSAVYSESLYLALSVGVFLCARRGRWALAAGCAALAAATRSTGIVLALPLALLYLYGPREDRLPDRERASGLGAVQSTHAGAQGGSVFARLRPRYRLHADSLWILLVPTGVALYMAHLALAGGDALSPFSAQAGWSRHFAGPYGGVWDGLKAAWQGARQLLSFQRAHVYFPVAGASPTIAAGHNLMLFAFLVAGAGAVVGVLRLLPLAYGAYLLGALALPLSYPVASQPLMSLPRFLLVLFPLNIWFAVRLLSRPRLTRALLVLSALALAFFAAEFSTWHWVA
ncbi:MAG TPA: mannosyltransferase family protein [Solirubrobacteraceae bacterium]|nr:mannosyltransferase family protein [Solirubrobacteraceae bacterium]